MKIYKLRTIESKSNINDKKLSFSLDLGNSKNYSEIMDEPQIKVFTGDHCIASYCLSTLDKTRCKTKTEPHWGWCVQYGQYVDSLNVSDKKHRSLVNECHRILKKHRLYSNYIRNTEPF